MKNNVNVQKLIDSFTDMSKRETLITGNVAQSDLLNQIIGTIVAEAMSENECREE